MIHQLKMDFKRVIVSPKSYLSILGIVIICWISTKSYFRGNPDSYYILDLLISLSFFKKLIILFSALPFVACFCEDWKHQYIRSVVIRSGKNNYIYSKILICVCSSFLVTFLGITCFLLLYNVFLSHGGDIGNLSESLPYGMLINRNPLVYFFIIISIYSMSLAMWTISGLMMSSYMQNTFIAICTPIIFSYLIEEITYSYPLFMNLYTLARGYDILGLGALGSYLYTILVFVCMIALQGYVFGKNVKRRLSHEII